MPRVLFSTAGALSSGIRSWGSEKFAMLRNEFPLTSPPSASRAVRRASAADSLSAVTQRLADAERELRVQFTRIAQLQAQLDLVLAALRRSPDGVLSDERRSEERRVGKECRCGWSAC